MIIIKNYAEKYGQTLGGLLGIAGSAVMYYDYKLAGFSLAIVAVVAVVLVVASQFLRK